MYVKFLLLFSIIITNAVAVELRLCSYSWPPYTGKELPGGGVSTRILQEVFEEAGVTFSIEWLSREQAMLSAKKGLCQGVFPAFFQDRIAGMYTSEVIGFSSLGFVQHKSRPIQWIHLHNLTKYYTGVVFNQSYTPKYDQMLDEEQIRYEVATDDVENIEKLSTGGIETAIMDQNVFEYLLREEKIGSDLEMNENMLARTSFMILYRMDLRSTFMRINQQLGQSDILTRQTALLEGKE